MNEQTVKRFAVRAGGASSFMSPEGMVKTAALQDQLWAIADRAKTISDTVATGLFIQSLNDLIDMDSIR